MFNLSVKPEAAPDVNIMLLGIVGYFLLGFLIDIGVNNNLHFGRETQR
jgi:hypothetical protein